jgi:hypothetical protein
VRDAVLFATLTVAFAAWVTAHVAIAARLALGHKPRWRGAVALVVPPLAPMWGARAGLRKNVWIWAGSLAVYAVCLVAAKIAR